MEPQLNGARLKQALRSGCARLGNQKEEVNRLNVFPVPDGDTGTNMHLTLLAAMQEADKASETSAAKVIAAAAQGALMGARGNSGVILSQLLRGFSQGTEGRDVWTEGILAAGWQNAVEVAYRAVVKPVEGTILTVARSVAQAMQRAVAEGCASQLDLLAWALRAGEETLQRTPLMLPTLARAGVVDAGGKGLLLWLDGFREALAGREIAVLEPAAGAPVELPAAAFQTEEDIPFCYCTEFLLRGENLPLDDLRARLEQIGSSLLVVGTASLGRVHVHTNNPGQALEAASAWGTLHQIKIDNMRDQHRDLLVEETPASSGLAVVAVAAGDGLARMLQGMGVSRVVHGGQTMNPSASELAEAVRALNPAGALILPNNPNVIATARQASGLLDCPIHVVPSRNVAQGLAAVVAFDPRATLEENARRMEEAAGGVHCGEVTFAVRDSRLGELQIAQGDYLGLLDGELVACGKTPGQVLGELAERVSGCELLTVLYGADVEQREAEAQAERLRDLLPDCTVELHAGGQPVYLYIFSAE